MTFKRVWVVAFAALVFFEAQAADNYRFERMWPTLKQPWYFLRPGAVVADETGAVFVADTGQHRVVKLNSDGKVISTISFPIESTIVSFLQPVDLRLTDRGTLQVILNASNVSNGEPAARVVELTRSLELLDTFLVPNAFRFGPDDDLFSFDVFTFEVARQSGETFLPLLVDLKGDGINQIQNFHDLFVDQSGNLYVTDTNSKKVVAFDNTGSHKFTLSDLAFPRGVAVSENGLVYVCTNVSVEVFNAEGLLESSWRYDNSVLKQADACEGIDLIREGDNELVVLRGGSGIYFFTKEGVALDDFASVRGIFSDSGFSRIDDMVVVDGQTLVIDTATQVKVFDPNLRYLRQFQARGGVKYQVVDGMLVVFTSSGRIDFYELDGTRTASRQLLLDTVPSTSFLSTAALASDGSVFAVLHGNSEVLKFDDTGTLVQRVSSNSQNIVIVGDVVYIPEFSTIRTFDLDLNSIAEIPISKARPDSKFVIAEDGRFYVRNLLDGTISEHAKSGELLQTLSGPGVGPGRLSRPDEIVMDTDGNLVVADAGNNRLQKFVRTPTANAKAIIVAGGGPYVGNDLWDATQLSANFAYRTLTIQGFTKENIYYLTSDTDLDLDLNGEADDVDANATKANLRKAMTEWAADADEVVIYLVNHGGVDTFRMSGTEILSATEFASWLDTLQATIPGRATTVYDACESGSFQAALVPDPGMERTVITSTAPGENAVFISQGSISFSNYFWTNVFNGASLSDAFNQSALAIGNTVDHQHPQLDADGNGVVNEASDFELLRDQFLGSGVGVQSQAPQIAAVSAPQTISGTSTASVRAEGVTDTDGVARVWAVVRPPDYRQGESGSPTSGLPTIELLPVGSDRYEGTGSLFTIAGTYQIAVYAIDRIGNTTVPKLTQVTVESALSRKAVIVAAGEVIDQLWAEYESSGRIAYEALTQQGYTDDNIYYMSATGTVGVDVSPTLGNLEFALTEWATEQTQDVVLYVVGAGRAGGVSFNRDETLTATQLDGFLDSLESAIPGTTVTIMEADRAGLFARTLSSERSRIIVTSTDTQDANFFVGGQLSFSKFFWRKIFNGATIRDAFLFADRAMRFATGSERALLNDDGNTTPNEKNDGRFARQYRLGTGILLAGDEPFIGTITEPSNLNGETSFKIRISNIASTSTLHSASILVTSPSGVVRAFTAQPGDTSVEVDIGDLTEAGDYEIAVYLQDAAGNQSLPATTTITQLKAETGSHRLLRGKIIRLDISGALVTDSRGLAQVIPANASAAFVNVTSVGPGGDGFITVWPCSVDRPLASNVNYTRGDVRPNGVIAPIGSNGKVCFYSSADTDVVVDIAGWFVGEAFFGATPTRLVDTRFGLGADLAKVSGASPLSMQVAGLAVTSINGVRQVIPASINAAALNVTVVNPERAGFITVYPCEAERPLSSNVNFVAGQTVANGVIAPDGQSGDICVYSSQPADVVIDLAGWFVGESFKDATPKRLVDTREGLGSVQGGLQPGTVLEIPLMGQSLDRSGAVESVSSAASAAALNVTAVNPAQSGFVTVYPCGVDRPLASNLNFNPGDVVANNVIAPLGDSGSVCVHTSVPTHIVVDVSGWFETVEGDGFAGATPKRMVDTRDKTGPGPE